MTAERHSPASSAGRRGLWGIGLAAAIAAGIVFRLIWLQDIEFKMDEAGAVYVVREFWTTHQFPWVGIDSSTGLPNPGLNLWLLLAIGGVLPSIGPLEMTRAIQIANVVALLGLVWFAQRGIEPREREPWLWSAALVAVNPLSVLFSRKLWTQELFPLFTLPFLVGWYFRERRWGAFLWGLEGVLLGQVHLTGFLFAAPFVAVTFFFARQSVRWPAWFLGSALGGVPLIPWLIDALTQPHATKPLELQNPVVPFGNWVNYALGADLYKTLGPDFPEFITFPSIGGVPTYGAMMALAAIAVLFIIILIRLVWGRDNANVDLWAAARSTPTGLALLAGFIGFGILLGCMLHPAYLHYLIVAFSLPVLSLAWLGVAASGDRLAMSRRLLAAMVMAQAALTLCFLCFVHETQTIRGDYGTAYGSQRH